MLPLSTVGACVSDEDHEIKKSERERERTPQVNTHTHIEKVRHERSVNIEGVGCLELVVK